MTKRRLAIVTSHPIQYYAPVFRRLATSDRVDPRVFYTWSQAAESRQFDPGFGIEIQWDVPLLGGYAHQFVRNAAARPGTDHFNGLQNPTLIQEIEAWSPDALLMYGWNSRSHLQALRHFKGRIPVLFRGDSTLLDDRSWWRKLGRRVVLGWVYSHVDMAVAVGMNSRDYFAWCGLPAEQIVFAPHAVDTKHFSQRGEERRQLAAEWRLRLGIDPEAVVFLFAGKLQEKKNPGLLLDVFLTLQDASHLIFVGAGDAENELRSRAAAHANVHFLPFQNQSFMPTVYRLGDIFVLPSRGPAETWGLALNEALAAGVPIIASSKVGGARDLVHADSNGWMFDSEDARGLKIVMRRAVDLGRSGLKSMGLAAQRSSSGWSIDESALRIEQAVVDCRRY